MHWLARTGVICVALSGAMAAQAADLSAITKAPPAPVYSPRWTDYYIGGHLGGAWSNVDADPYSGPLFPAFFFNPGIPTIIAGAFGDLGSASGRDSSFLGGVQIGHNWQAGAWVFGVEADASGTDLSATASRSAIRSPGTTVEQTVPVDSAVDINWMVSLRGRLGYSFNNILLYATGGAAIADLQARGNAAATFGPATLAPAPGTYTATTSDSHLRLGWTIGGGFEWAIDQAWSIGAEYRYTDFGSVTVVADIPDGLGNVFATVSSDTRVTVEQATLRVNYRLMPR